MTKKELIAHSSKLKPCPFCGKDAHIRLVGRCDLNKNNYDVAVQCTNCGADLYAVFENVSEEQAVLKMIEYWNRRHMNGEYCVLETLPLLRK